MPPSETLPPPHVDAGPARWDRRLHAADPHARRRHLAGPVPHTEGVPAGIEPREPAVVVEASSTTDRPARRAC
eukprot:5907245-Prymnesium_polylepis.1